MFEIVLLVQALLGGLVAARLMQGRAVPVAGRWFPVRQVLSRVALTDLAQGALPLHAALIAGYRLTGVMLVGLVLVARA
ncbi:hypothetical protein [Kineosporia sp. NBRC 101731]|uniref:hypothetical protein n=1 Tax=Kineosporia sp. NBRC 101731 TaxID=3032199 RepID=UPI0024A34469|nr:hypothetical protein [Kineosporia sp. NBRC 101731]GLY28199.1 hypothetical protein Kisp02_15640 [Kineosporia sp. NBRC 101731]